MTSLNFRFWRYIFLTPVLGAVGLTVLWGLGFVSFLITILSITPMQVDFKTDGIVVLTGGAERVKTGLELLQNGHTRELLISGVHKSTDLRDLIAQAKLPPDAFPCCITLGFAATDTVGNAHETAQWMRDHHIRNLRLVTASYHMPRALIEMKRALPGVRLIAHPVTPDPFSPWSKRGWILTVSEYHKTLLALTRFSIERLQTAL